MNKYERFNQEQKLGPKNKKKRVAAYCRVSTDKEDQANSFESQQRYFRQYIQHSPDWELYEIFADEGLSGTNTKKRSAFNRMIACAQSGDFDLIITKEISRFARNTLDSIYYTRVLKKHGVGVIFMNDNINTLDSDAELRLAILSSIAQEESRKTSERVKWGQKRQMEQGVVFGRDMLGYDVRGGKMYINEEGAKIVRKIFYKFTAEGKGTHVIARELREEGILPMRVKEWQNTVILRILRNEKYCGDLVQKKTYTPDFLSHEKKYNRGQEEFVIIRDHHEPIISRELFEKAGRILDERSQRPGGKSKYSNRYPFSGKIKCGCCGASCVARSKIRKDGSRYRAWRCLEAVQNGSPHQDAAGCRVGCIALGIRNEEVVHLMCLVTKSLKFNRQKLTDHLLSTIQSVLFPEMSNAGKKRSQAAAAVASSAEKGCSQTAVVDAPSVGKGCSQAAAVDAPNVGKGCSQAAAVDAPNVGKECSQAVVVDAPNVGKGYSQAVVVDASNVGKKRSQAAAAADVAGSDGGELKEAISRQQELIKEIGEVIKELVGGMEEEDAFYRGILDKMVVYDRGHIDVYLQFLPFKWSYRAIKASPQSASPQSASPQNASSQIASPQIASPQIASLQSASPQNASPQIASPQSASPQIASLQSASPQNASSQIVSSQNASPRMDSHGTREKSVGP